MLHLATATSGGAAIAAARLVQAQRRIGLDATMTTQDHGVVIGPTSRRKIPRLSRLLQRGTTAIDLGLARDRRYFFSPLERGILTMEDIQEVEPDVVHVHNWFNFFPWTLAPQLRKQGIPLVATAHDERIMTGGCHTALGCDRYLAGCPQCPQSRIGAIAHRPAVRLHQKLVVARVAVVAPSSWLSRRLAARFEGTPVAVHEIPNCLDTEVFSPTEVEKTREASIGIIPGKADELLQATLDELASLLGSERVGRITLRVAGLAPAPSWPGLVVRHGLLRSETARADFFRACDVALLPTHADNFPNVNLEATLCGAAVLTCDVGGSGEVVRATGRGLTLDESPRELAEGAVKLLSSTGELRNGARGAWATAKDLYGNEPVAWRYKAVYDAAIDDLSP